MSNTNISRNADYMHGLTATTSAATASQLSLAQASGGLIHINSGAATAVVLSFYVLPDTILNPTAQQLFSGTNTAITITVQNGRSYPLPDELFPARLFYVVAASGSVVFSVTSKT